MKFKYLNVVNTTKRLNLLNCYIKRNLYRKNNVNYNDERYTNTPFLGIYKVKIMPVNITFCHGDYISRVCNNRALKNYVRSDDRHGNTRCVRKREGVSSLAEVDVSRNSKTDVNSGMIPGGTTGINREALRTGISSSHVMPSLDVAGAHHLSFYLVLHNTVYYIKRRVYREAGIPFYRLDPSFGNFLRTISGLGVPKVVFNDGFDLFQHMRNFFGVTLRNLIDLNYLYMLSMKLDSVRLEVPSLGQMLYGKRKEGFGLKSHILCGKKLHSIYNKRLAFSQSSRDNEHLSNLCGTYEWLMEKLKIARGQAINNKLSEVYDKIANLKLNLYQTECKQRLHSNNLRAFKEALFNNILNNENYFTITPLKQATDSPFSWRSSRYEDHDLSDATSGGTNEESGHDEARSAEEDVLSVVDCVLKYRKEGGHRVMLLMNSYLVDRVSGFVIPLYGIVSGDWFKYFSDQSIGDVVQCTTIK